MPFSNKWRSDAQTWFRSTCGREKRVNVADSGTAEHTGLLSSSPHKGIELKTQFLPPPEFKDSEQNNETPVGTGEPDSQRGTTADENDSIGTTPTEKSSQPHPKMPKSVSLPVPIHVIHVSGEHRV